MRSKALGSIDKMLSWVFDQKHYSYCLKTPLQEETFVNNHPKLITFSKHHGYFSSDRPLVGKVTKDQKDVKVTLQLLQTIHKVIKDPKMRALTTGEILTKVLAYRNLKKDQEISIPSASGSLVPFKVDELFDLWDGMPAFGLIPQISDESAPILLYRGTDLSLLSQRGLASILSDFDTKGPGLSAFLHARKSIHEWLKKVALSGQKARVMGFSLGGALAAYTLLYEHELINLDRLESSYAFNPPGISKKSFRRWERLSPEERPPFTVFVTRGDLISKIGWLSGDVYELSLSSPLYPIAAHVTLLSGEPLYHQYQVDLLLENHSHRFSR